MGKTTRRDFLKTSGCTVLTVGLSQHAFFRRTQQASASALTAAAALSTTNNVLVVVQLDGGNDGLNTVIPAGGRLYGLYRDARPQLSVPDTEILPLGADAANNRLGLHPAMAPLKVLYDRPEKPVAIIQGVGYPNPNRSHFRSQDIWHTANPERIEKTGWLGDYLDVVYPSVDNPFLAVSVGGELPLMLRSQNRVIPGIDNLDEYQIYTGRGDDADTANKVHTFLALNRVGAPEQTLYEHIRRTALELYESTQAVQRSAQNYTADPTIVYPDNNPLAGALRQVAQIIAANLGTRIFYVGMGGFDTHTAQSYDHANLLATLSEAIDPFYRDMVRLGQADRVLLMTWSEFGRKVKQNADIGTDHGAAAPQVIVGGAVKGGIYGVHPNLTDLYDEDDMKHSIDFRSVYATILEQWFGVSSREILGGRFEPIRFL